jgi:hypothetical protein
MYVWHEDGQGGLKHVETSVKEENWFKTGREKYDGKNIIMNLYVWTLQTDFLERDLHCLTSRVVDHLL